LRAKSVNMKPFDFDKLKAKFLDGGRCICDICGKKGKLGGSLINEKTNEVLVACYNCTLRVSAEREGITKKEAERRRKRMFGVSYLFQEEKFKEYITAKGKKRFSSLEEANKVLAKVQNAWNNLTTEQRKSFEEKEDTELRKIYKNIKVFNE